MSDFTSIHSQPASAQLAALIISLGASEFYFEWALFTRFAGSVRAKNSIERQIKLKQRTSRKQRSCLAKKVAFLNLSFGIYRKELNLVSSVIVKLGL